MVLSDRDIKKALKTGRIKIRPKPDLKTQLGSCSLDLRLGSTFRLFNHSKLAYLDPLDKSKNGENATKEVVVKKNDPFIVQPGEFVLATTVEHVQLADDLLGRLEGRSSLGRLGIIVHSTAAVFDPGWRGKVVMELGNLGRMPVALYPGMRVCSLTFEEVSSKVEVPYWKKKGAKYVNQKGPEPSKLFKEKETVKGS
ncbi:MAG TPA: dCTP deaminase [Candidatus Bathyarchaeia archaeon]|nr:dCTP deaminase [Candidatus Bathyarchaeia archaeon]